MDYDVSEYDSGVNDVQKPAQFLIHLIDQYLQTLQDSLKNASNLLILDLGCGPGNTVQMLAKHYPNAHILGLDVDPEMIRCAQEKRIPRAEFFVQNIEQPWSEWSKDIRKYQGKIDIIFSNYTLHWISDVESLAKSVGQLLNESSGFFTGNLLYCGWLQSTANDPGEKSLLDRLICYPSEKEFVSNFIWALRNHGDFHWMNLEYQEPVSRFPRKFYAESFIEIPIKWYRKFLNTKINITDEENRLLDETLKKLILEQRICGTIPANDPKDDEQIDIKQQLWIFQVKKFMR